MSDFVGQSLLMKNTDSDTYMLFPLIKQNNNIVLDINSQKEKDLIEKLKQLLLNKEDVMNIDYNRFDVEDINTDSELIDTFIEYIYTIDFTNALQEQIEDCGSSLQLNSIVDINNYTYYGIFSLNNILNCFRYWVYNLFVKEEENEVLYPYGFMTIKKYFRENSSISMKNLTSDPWVPSEFFFIENMCETNKISEKRVCFYMLNLLVNDINYSEYPLFIKLHNAHTGNEPCYIENKFKKVKDIISGIELENQEIVYHNKYPIQITGKNTDGSNRYVYLAPSTTYRFAIISHGKISIEAKNLENKNNYKQYIYPFKNIQYYIEPNCVLSLGSNIDGMEQTVVSVCYDNIPSLKPETPVNNKLITIPMIFSGPKIGDPQSRAESFGLYDCQNKIKIKTNVEFFGVNNNTEREFDYIFKVLFNYCLNNNIPLKDVELKIFACRTCCPPSKPQSMIIDGGENEKSTGKTDSVTGFESVNKKDFFQYLMKNATSCAIPKKGGKKKRKETRHYKKKSIKNKTRKHKKYT